MRGAALGLVALLFTACSSGQPATFAVTSASVDPLYSCPGGSNNAPYDLHATVDVRNGTSKAVTIDSVGAQLKLVAVQGPWLERPGDLYDAGAATFAPTGVPAGASDAVMVTIHSFCTSNSAAGTSHGDYTVTMKLVTSAGSYSITAKNQHEIRAA